MTTDTINTQQLFTFLDETWNELLELISDTNGLSINAVPFTDSWTAAQLATHVTKSNKAIAQALTMEGIPADRNPERGVADIKKMFLDFNAKYTSPDFIVPETGTYNKENVIALLTMSIDKIRENKASTNLIEIINLPLFGDVTKLELLYFVLYHTQRHIHQLKKIIKALRLPENINHK